MNDEAHDIARRMIAAQAAERQAFIDETAQKCMAESFDRGIAGTVNYREWAHCALNAAEALWAERERRRTGEKP